MFTKNEKKAIRFLFANTGTDHSINELSRLLGMSPNGTIKILKKYSKEGILNTKKIANINSYIINFENEKTDALIELVLIPHLDLRLQNRYEDLKGLKEVTEAAVIFGSYTDPKKKPNDIDALFVLKEQNYKNFRNKLQEVISPVKIHDILQTREDLKKNIIKKDKIIMEILNNGIILWGQSTIIEVMRDAYSRQT